MNVRNIFMYNYESCREQIFSNSERRTDKAA